MSLFFIMHHLSHPNSYLTPDLIRGKIETAGLCIRLCMVSEGLLMGPGCVSGCVRWAGYPAVDSRRDTYGAGLCIRLCKVGWVSGCVSLEVAYKGFIFEINLL
jgi:hypothetical protein